MFEYVQKSEYMPIKEELEQIIHRAQDIVREYFTFSYRYIGSSSRNMITCDYDSNIGFDFDINVYVNDEDEEYSAKEIKHILMNAFNRASSFAGYNPCEDSTRVFTMKFVDRKHSLIRHSCDFAIVHDFVDDERRDRQEYIRFNKKDYSYTWEDQPIGYDLSDKEDWLKNNNYWNDVRNCYIDKKNNNTDPDKKSRSLYAEAVNEVYNYYNS